MTSQGSPHSRFRRALLTRNLMIIRTAAAELPQISLTDALEICVVMREVSPDRYEAAAIKWIARYCVERPNVTLEHLDAAVEAFAAMQQDAEAGLQRLQVLCAPVTG